MFHPEASRVARMASGGRYGFAQSLFQVGGNAGRRIGPLLAAFIVMPRGQGSIAWFSLVALLGMVVLSSVGLLVRGATSAGPAPRKPAARAAHGRLDAARRASHRDAAGADVLQERLHGEPAQLLHLLPDRAFHVSVQTAQLHLFVFLAAVAVGTFVGGPIGDRFGRRPVIWISILGVAAVHAALPYAACSGRRC